MEHKALLEKVNNPTAPTRSGVQPEPTYLLQEKWEKGSLDFNDAWEMLSTVGLDLPMLRSFCTGLGTIFPNTATVESDFSVIGIEKSIYKTNLSDFSLESILHAKQFRRMYTK